MKITFLLLSQEKVFSWVIESGLQSDNASICYNLLLVSHFLMDFLWILVLFVFGETFYIGFTKQSVKK